MKAANDNVDINKVDELMQDIADQQELKLSAYSDILAALQIPPDVTDRLD